MANFRIFFFIFSSIILRISTKKLPHYIKTCSLKHDLKNCVIKNGNEAIPYIVKGDPGYNVPNLSPFNIPFIALINTPSLVLNLTDLHLFGLDEGKLEDLIPLDIEKLSFTATFSIKNVTISGDYSVDGRVLVMPLHGTGKFTMNLMNGIYRYTSAFEKKKFGKEEFYQNVYPKLMFQFENATLNLDNLFNGDVNLGKQVNKFLNENWDILLVDFGQGIADTVAALIQQIFNGIAKNVPAKEVFLPN